MPAYLQRATRNALIEQAKRGEFTPDLLRAVALLVTRLGGDEDVVQDVAFALWRKLGTIDTSKNPFSWLTSTARTTILFHRRTRFNNNKKVRGYALELGWRFGSPVLLLPINAKACFLASSIVANSPSFPLEMIRTNSHPPAGSGTISQDCPPVPGSSMRTQDASTGGAFSCSKIGPAPNGSSAASPAQKGFPHVGQRICSPRYLSGISNFCPQVGQSAILMAHPSQDTRNLMGRRIIAQLGRSKQKVACLGHAVVIQQSGCKIRG
jgi:hypothetical protein